MDEFVKYTLDSDGEVVSTERLDPAVVYAVLNDRKRRVDMLKKWYEAERCECGSLCEGWDNGMSDAIYLMEGDSQWMS